MAFKVLIIGGSVTGLTLAAILERYGIDYTLFEKHADFAPEMGASIALLAHGSRVLDQLGCFNELLPFGVAAEGFDMYGPDGKHLGVQERLGTNLEAMLGYPIYFVERRRVLQSLWGAIKDKSKIHLSTKIAKIEIVAGVAHVETQDGRVFTGDILVGADGIKSRTRDEMWRLAEADNHSTVADRKAIRNNCSCIFGISSGLPQVKATQTWKHFRKDRHYFCAAAPNGLTFWFLSFKTRKEADRWENLRYTNQEKEDYAAEFSNDQVRSGLTFGEMYKASKTTVLVPVEEFVLRRYYYKRILLIGDSAHKMHPITGQGGNSAIEDAAFFGNRLKDLLQTESNPTESEIESIFHHLQEKRRPRTQMLADGARRLAHMETFGTPLLKLIMLYWFPRVPGENTLASLGESMTQGEPLKYLPLPARSNRLLPYDEEVQVTPNYRPTAASYAWICLFMCIGSLRFILPAILTNEEPFFTTESPVMLPFPHTWNRYIEDSYFAITALWTIESYRSAFSLSPILTPIPWIFLARYCGWEVALPFYFAFWVLGSSFQGFYHPWPRAILPAAARALPIAVSFSITNREAFTRFRIFTSLNSPTISHLLIPVVTALIEWGIARVHGRRWEPVYQFGDYDVKYLDQFFLCSVVSAVGHMIMLLFDIIPDIRQGNGPLLLRTPEIFNFGVFTLLIAAWLLFTAWDLRRVSVLNLNLVTVSFYIILGVLFLGPGATLMGAWWWREKLWEKSRQRLSEERYDKVERGRVLPIIKT